MNISSVSKGVEIPITNPTSHNIFDDHWHHLAFVRKKNTVYFFVDGQLQGTKDVKATGFIGSKTLPLLLGKSGYSGNFYTGELDDVVIVKGKAFWTEDFELPKNYLLDDEQPEEPALPKDGVPAGMIMHFVDEKAPQGWLECDGSEVSKTQYANLFKVVGEKFGQVEDKTKFKLPDLRGEFIRSWDNGRGIDKSRVLGSAQKGFLSSVDTTMNTTNVVGLYNAVSGNYREVCWDNAGMDGFARSDYQGIRGGYVDVKLTEDDITYYAGVVRPRNIALLACIKY